MEKRIENDVIVYSDDVEILELAKKVTTELKLNLMYADCTTDLYAFSYFFGIIDPDKLENDFFNIFKEIYELENPKEFTIFLTKLVKYIPRDIKKYFTQTETPNIGYQQIKLAILNKRSAILRHKKNPKAYDKKLFRLFSMLRKMSPEGEIIRIEEMCQEFNVSDKTIRRDIDMMRYAGEDIQYDKVRKGYYLVGSWNSKIVVRND